MAFLQSKEKFDFEFQQSRSLLHRELYSNYPYLRSHLYLWLIRWPIGWVQWPEFLLLIVNLRPIIIPFPSLPIQIRNFGYFFVLSFSEADSSSTSPNYACYFRHMCLLVPEFTHQSDLSIRPKIHESQEFYLSQPQCLVNCSQHSFQTKDDI